MSNTYLFTELAVCDSFRFPGDSQLFTKTGKDTARAEQGGRLAHKFEIVRVGANVGLLEPCIATELRLLRAEQEGREQAGNYACERGRA